MWTVEIFRSNEKLLWITEKKGQKFFLATENIFDGKAVNVQLGGDMGGVNAFSSAD